jgi:hypothetical protein
VIERRLGGSASGAGGLARMTERKPSEIRNVARSMPKVSVTPKAAISTPPSAGPASIPTLPRTHSSAIAAFICSRGTTRGTSASSGGRSSA